MQNACDVMALKVVKPTPTVSMEILERGLVGGDVDRHAFGRSGDTPQRSLKALFYRPQHHLRVGVHTLCVNTV